MDKFWLFTCKACGRKEKLQPYHYMVTCPICMTHNFFLEKSDESEDTN